MIFYERMSKVVLPLTAARVLDASEGRLCINQIHDDRINYILFRRYLTTPKNAAIIVACANQATALFLDSENPGLFKTLGRDARFLQWKRAANETVFIHTERVVRIDPDFERVSQSCSEMADPLVHSLISGAQIAFGRFKRQFQVLVFSESVKGPREIPVLVPRRIAQAIVAKRKIAGPPLG